MQKILAIDDNLDFLGVLKDELGGDYQVLCASNYEKALELLTCHPIEVALLDINMPDSGGLQICSEIRARYGEENPIVIFISAEDGPATRMSCYKVGGDHFLAKPYHKGELKALIGRCLEKSKLKQSFQLSFGDISLELGARLVKIGTRNVDLGQKEFHILSALMRNKENTVSRNRLLDIAWSNELDICDRVIDTHISNLRKKLRHSQVRIKAVYQEGYKLMKHSAL